MARLPRSPLCESVLTAISYKHAYNAIRLLRRGLCRDVVGLGLCERCVGASAMFAAKFIVFRTATRSA